jgi:hypothetical protein
MLSSELKFNPHNCYLFLWLLPPLYAYYDDDDDNSNNNNNNKTCYEDPCHHSMRCPRVAD